MMSKIFAATLFVLLISNEAYADPPKVVYRAASDLDSPDNIRRQGGFLPRGMDGTRPNQPPPNISLYNHTIGIETGAARHDSGYVATTDTHDFGLRWITEFLGGQGYLYHIRPTPNFVDVNASLGRYSPHPSEHEHAALGRIQWRQIIGWQRIEFGVAGAFVQNPQFNAVIFSEPRSAGNQPQLAGFPENHLAWSQVPWVEFATCELRASCTPNRSAQTEGEAMFRLFNRRQLSWVVLLFLKLNTSYELEP